jgi:hypothetical protein
MFANVLFVTFVNDFITTIALGQVLLIIAIWPDPSAKR